VTGHKAGGSKIRIVIEKRKLTGRRTRKKVDGKGNKQEEIPGRGDDRAKGTDPWEEEGPCGGRKLDLPVDTMIWRCLWDVQ
jgi:hypothetical protein